MKLVSFETGGKPGYGALVDGGILDLGRRHGAKAPTLKAFLGAGLASDPAAAQGAADLDPGAVRLLAPIPDPAKILCVGLNYESHKREMARADAGYPTLFARFADTLVGPEDALVHPRVTEKLDWEGELAVIIAKHCRAVALEDAWSVIGGYACFHDASVRDWQSHTTQFLPGKNFPATAGFGPWLVTPDEIADAHDLRLVTRVNGIERQNASTGDMIFRIPELIAYITTFTALAPGDVIATGTPAGVGLGMKPPMFMMPGDLVEIEIDGLGILRNPVRAEG